VGVRQSTGRAAEAVPDGHGDRGSPGTSRSRLRAPTPGAGIEPSVGRYSHLSCRVAQPTTDLTWGRGLSCHGVAPFLMRPPKPRNGAPNRFPTMKGRGRPGSHLAVASEKPPELGAVPTATRPVSPRRWRSRARARSRGRGRDRRVPP
jgi:hypothetical protein